jgi:hypothetical protein
MAKQYGQGGSKSALAKWKESHRPFHWFAEFYGVLKDGGFDVIIGNPPYVMYNPALSNYALRGYSTLGCANLFAFITERSLDLMHKNGRLGLIVPVSSISTEGYRSLQDIVFRYSGHFSSYDDRPARLFDGLEHIQLTIHLVRKQAGELQQFSTECLRWNAVERPNVFSLIEYQPVAQGYLPGCIPKVSSSHERDILEKIWRDKYPIGVQSIKGGGNAVYYSRKVHNFLQALDFVPEVYNGSGELRAPSELKSINFDAVDEGCLVFCMLNSTLFRWFVNVFSDCRHVNMREVEGFRLDLKAELKVSSPLWSDLAMRLSHNLKETSEFRKMRFKHDDLRVQCIIPKKSKLIIDEIDGKRQIAAAFFGGR